MKGSRDDLKVATEKIICLSTNLTKSEKISKNIITGVNLEIKVTMSMKGLLSVISVIERKIETSANIIKEIKK
ncbi:MAG: hypothetical protein ACRD5B_16860 [Nitrososphaeraceae archaeon]